MRFSTIFTALFYPYIAHERIAQNLGFVSSLVALILIECHRSQNKGLVKREERLSDFKERCAQLCHFGLFEEKKIHFDVYFEKYVVSPNSVDSVV